MEVNISSRMAQVYFFYSLSLTFIFKVIVLSFSCNANISQTVRDRANITINHEVGSHVSNGATANIEHHELDLYFQGHTILVVNISIYKRISQTDIDGRKLPTDIQSGVRRTTQV